ncbi:OmpA family protein [Rhodopseudomonas palustris]|uniref:OmpA family protein n=1 Tax=Rhodopseudomonas palustris TaxID=1076 RepID=UPI002ACEB2EE|nr:OmpA family protein [Rhodopseudomonas palustris]WQG98717.1 OmpA family protein [Rhodopseudomonas palustris]
MKRIQLALLASTAIVVWQSATLPAHADATSVIATPMLMAQAAPADKGDEKKGPPAGERKGPPPGAAPPPPRPAAPPAAAPPAGRIGEPPAAPRAEPPPRPAPPPAPKAEPPAAPRAAPPPPPPAAATPPRPPAPPAEKSAPRAEPPAAPRVAPPPPPAAAPQQRQSAPPPADKGAAPPPRPAPPAAGQIGAPPAGQTPPPAVQKGGPPPAAAQPPAAQRSAPPQQPPAAPADKGAPPPAAGQIGSPPPAQTPPPPAAQKAAPPPPAAAPADKGAAAPPPLPAAGTIGPQGAQPGGAALPPGAPVARTPPPTVTTPIPAAPPPPQAMTPIAPGAAPQGPRNISDFRGERREVREGGRTVITEPGRVIVRDPGGREFIRHNEMDRFRYGARDIRTEPGRGGDTRTIVVRPDGTEIINVTGRDGQLVRRIRRDRDGREIIIIDNSFGPSDRANFYVDLPPPVLRIPRDRYIVDYEDASPELIYDTLEAPPVERIERRYSMDEIRYSPSVRQRMPSIDLNTITFELGSWDISPDQASKLQVIADGLNRAIRRNPREVFLIEGHTDATGNDTDNLSLSDRRAEAAATLLTQQFGVPAENLTSQGYGEQYLKVQTDGPERQNRRVTVRRITPLLNGGQAALPPPPPGVAPPR